MNALEVPASNNLTARGVHTPVNTEECKAFKTLFNKSAWNLEHSVLKHINKKQQMLKRTVPKNLATHAGKNIQKPIGNCIRNMDLLQRYCRSIAWIYYRDIYCI